MADTFEEQRATLIAVAEMFLNCLMSTEQILEKAMAASEGSPVRESFGPASAIRAVVKAAVAHNREAANSRTEVRTNQRYLRMASRTTAVSFTAVSKLAQERLSRIVINDNIQ